VGGPLWGGYNRKDVKRLKDGSEPTLGKVQTASRERKERKLLYCNVSQTSMGGGVSWRQFGKPKGRVTTSGEEVWLSTKTTPPKDRAPPGFSSVPKHPRGRAERAI